MSQTVFVTGSSTKDETVKLSDLEQVTKDLVFLLQLLGS